MNPDLKLSQDLPISLQAWGNSYLSAKEEEKTGLIMKIIEIEKTVSMSVVVSKESRSFNQLVRTDKIDRSNLLTTISTYMFIMLNELFNIEKTITKTQMVLFVEEFISLEHLTLQDAILFMNGIRKGKFGKIYGKIDVGTLNEFFDKYLDEREQAFEASRARERNECNVSGNRSNTVQGIQNVEKHINQLFGKQIKRAGIYGR